MTFITGNHGHGLPFPVQEKDRKAWLQRKNTEETGKGLFKLSLTRSQKRGVASVLTGGGIWVCALIGAAVVSPPEGPARIPPSAPGVVGGKLGPSLVTVAAATPAAMGGGWLEADGDTDTPTFFFVLHSWVSGLCAAVLQLPPH